MNRVIALCFFSILLTVSCRTRTTIQEIPQIQEQPYIPKYLMLSVGPANLKDQKEGHSIVTEDDFGADRCEFHSLKIGKEAWLHATTVAENVIAGGEARFYGSKVKGSVHVCGQLHAQCSQFSGCVDVEDDVIAVDTVFCGLLQAKAEIIDLTNVKAQTIYVKATGPYYDKQLVYIKGHSVIAGDVIFESERGRVIYDINSQVLGSIRGGHAIPSYECDRIMLESNHK